MRGWLGTNITFSIILYKVAAEDLNLCHCTCPKTLPLCQARCQILDVSVLGVELKAAQARVTYVRQVMRADLGHWGWFLYGHQLDPGIEQSLFCSPTPAWYMGCFEGVSLPRGQTCLSRGEQNNGLGYLLCGKALKSSVDWPFIYSNKATWYFIFWLYWMYSY